MNEIHRLMHTDPELWTRTGSPLHDPKIEPRFGVGHLVRKSGSDKVYRIAQRSIDMDSNVTYTLQPGDFREIDARAALLAAHEQRAADEAMDPKDYAGTTWALMNAPGFDDVPPVQSFSDAGEPEWDVPEANLEPIDERHLSPGKKPVGSGKTEDPVSLNDEGKVTKGKA